MDSYIKFFSLFGFILLVIFCILLFINLIAWLISIIRSEKMFNLRKLNHSLEQQLNSMTNDLGVKTISYDKLFVENRELKLMLDKLSKKKVK